MHDYLLSSEWVRFAFVLGVAVSMVLYEKRHLTTGSIVVPGYIAVFIVHPLVILATFLNALITYALVNHVLRRFFLLYGRTKFTLLAVISTIIQTIMLRLTPDGQWLWELDIPLFIGVGYIVPALIAHDMARQGVAKTTKSVMLAGFIVATPIALALIFDLPGVNDLAPIDGFGNIAIEPQWLPLAVILSVAGSWAVAMNYGMRSGGFIGAAFMGMFMADPWQVLAALTIATATYLIVTRVLMDHMILFGRRKFSSMLLISSGLAWASLWLGEGFLPPEWQSHLGVGSLALTPLLVPGLLANDAQRTSPRNVLQGLVLAGMFVVTTTWWIQATVTGGQLHPGWKLLSLTSICILFAPQGKLLFARFQARVESRVPGRPVAEILSDDERSDGADADHAEQVDADAVETAAARLLRVERWSSWAAHHSDAAAEAERWLDELLGAPAATTDADDVVPAAASTSALDDLNRTVLRSALDAARGVNPVPRRRAAADHTRQQPPAGAPAEISGVSGEEHREAQLSSPDASDHQDPTTGEEVR